MRSFSHLFGSALEHAFDHAIASERNGTASIVACIIELEDQKFYLAAGYASLHAYCVARGLSEGGAFRRIHAARAVRRFPALLEALDRGDLNLTSVNLLAPHLTEGNELELIAAAARKNKPELESMLAERFPRSEFLAIGALVELPDTTGDPNPVPEADTQLALAPVNVKESSGSTCCAERRATRAPITPVAPDRDLLNLPIRRATTAKLNHAAELMSHTVPSGDMAEVLDRALDLAIAELERRKCAKTDSPRPRRSRTRDPRHIPAHVRRAVWERDGGLCTFVGEGGHRCGSRSRLELDHIVPVARGGESTVANLRLRCRAHNQYEAERMFGADFMQAKRERARATSRPAGAAAKTESPGTRLSDDVSGALRTLGYRDAEIRRALEYSESGGAATSEERLRLALRYLMPKVQKITPVRTPIAASEAPVTKPHAMSVAAI